MHIGPFYPNPTQLMGKNGRSVEENYFIVFYRGGGGGELWFSVFLRSVCVVIPKYSSSMQKTVSSHFLFRTYEELKVRGSVLVLPHFPLQ